jgi:hypothetical protein
MDIKPVLRGHLWVERFSEEIYENRWFYMKNTGIGKYFRAKNLLTNNDFL